MARFRTMILRNGKHYSLAEDGLALPVKRIPGLALPDGDHLLDGEPLLFTWSSWSSTSGSIEPGKRPASSTSRS